MENNGTQSMRQFNTHAEARAALRQTILDLVNETESIDGAFIVLDEGKTYSVRMIGSESVLGGIMRFLHHRMPSKTRLAYVALAFSIGMLVGVLI